MNSASISNPALVIFDETNPWSVINICPAIIRKAIKTIPREHFIINEKKLKELAAPDEIEARFRLLFWDEYNAAVDEKRQMRIENIVTSRLGAYYEYFEHIILKNNRKLSWILTPPADYFLAMRDMLYLGLDRVREIMELPIIEDVIVRVLKDGTKVTRRQVNTRLIGEIVKITQQLNDRVHGAVVQRMAIQQKTVSFNMHQTNSQQSSMLGEHDVHPNPKQVPVPIPQERIMLPEMTELEALDMKLSAVNRELSKLVRNADELPAHMVDSDEELDSDPLAKFDKDLPDPPARKK